MIILLLLGALAVTPPEHCHDVHGTYAIFSDGDSLHITGSRHRVVVTDPTLDRQLEARGWLSTVAEGDFHICATRHVAPQALNRQDRVRIVRYSNIRFRPR